MTFTYKAGDLDKAFQVIEDESAGEASDGEKLVAAVGLLQASALRDVSDRLRHMEQTLHEMKEGD